MTKHSIQSKSKVGVLLLLVVVVTTLLTLYLSGAFTLENTAVTSTLKPTLKPTVTPIVKKKEVFAVKNNNEYNITKDGASEVCSALGAELATIEQLTSAQEYGADWCSTGWISNKNDAFYPSSNNIIGGCGNGNPGITTYTPDTNKAGVNCYGIKPDKREGILPFNDVEWNQPLSKRTKEEVFLVRKGNQYSIPYSEKNTVCTKFNAKVASLEQLTNAYKNNANWCSSGWVNDESETTGFFPNQTNITGCGATPGIKPYLHLKDNADVNCYGIKPIKKNTITEYTVLPFNEKNWFQQKI